MGDTIDVTGDNTLVLCFGFLLSKKQWLAFAKKLRVAYRNFFRFLHVMESFSDSRVNCRAGHVAVKYGTDSILVWGGYKENRDEEEQPMDHEYWPPNQVCMYNRLQRTWRTIETKGQFPPFSSGSTAVVYHNELYIFFGFLHYTLDSPNWHDEDLDDVEQELRQNSGIVEKNSNLAFVLNMDTLTWKKLYPSGKKPLRVDKLSSWIYGSKVYLFGGFGPPPEPNKDNLPSFVTHMVDNSTLQMGRQFTRGWTNQLAVYDILTNAWEWPPISGDIPSPRAAHACVANSQGDAYLFGGRHGNQRLSDLYHFDMRTKPHRWTLIHSYNPELACGHFPIGRSWHSFNLVDDYHGLIYGGYDLESKPLGDCWLVNLLPNDTSQRWLRLQHLEVGNLLWHCSVSLPVGQVCLIGGVQNDLLNRSLSPIKHPHRVSILSVSPPPLLVVALEAAVRNYRILKTSVPYLPTSLKVNVEERRKKFIYDRDKRV